MIISLPKTVRRMYLLILFMVLTYLLYHALNVLGAWISPLHNEEIPEGTAVRAFQEMPHSDESLGTGERLRLFYWYGE